MPISNKHKTIFIHIPKTGGTSITCGLGVEPIKENLHGTEYSHLTADQVKKEINPSDWKRFFKFAIVRNPYDRLVSEWAFQKKPKPFKEFALHIPITSTHFIEQHKFINDEINIYRFEEYEAIKTLLEKKGCFIPFMNRSDHNSYREYYDDESMSAVEELYKEDLKHFNYVF